MFPTPRFPLGHPRHLVVSVVIGGALLQAPLAHAQSPGPSPPLPEASTPQPRDDSGTQGPAEAGHEPRDGSDGSVEPAEAQPDPAATQEQGDAATQVSVPDATGSEPADQAARIEALERELAQQRALLERLDRAGKEAAGVSKKAAKPPKRAAEESVASTMRTDPLERMKDGSFPGSIPLFGSKFRFGIGGYVKLDALYDFDGVADRYQFTIASIPDENQPHYGPYFWMHARETRFSFDLRYTAPNVPINQAFLELDFFTPSLPNFVAPRMRHAYFKWGMVLVGQTWRLLTDLRTLPFIIDFAYADALNAQRAPQMRVEGHVSKWLGARVGLEMPEIGGVENPNAILGGVSPRMPQLAGGVSFEHPRGFVSVGGSVSELRWDVPDAADAHAVTWAAVLNMRGFLDASEHGFLALHASLGRGSTESMVGVFGGGNANAALRPDGTLDTMLAYSLVLSYAQRWIDPLSTNVSLAWDELQPSEYRSGDQMVRTFAAHGNIIWTVNDPIQTGIEYMVAERKNVDDSHGIAHRIQAMAMYSF